MCASKIHSKYEKKVQRKLPYLFNSWQTLYRTLSYQSNSTNNQHKRNNYLFGSPSHIFLAHHKIVLVSIRLFLKLDAIM